MDLSSLWLTADQRGDRLLASGDAAAAAKTYSDPRRRANAEAKAGDFTAAARDYATFDDTDAHYNRGNALARGGDLKGAIAAYDHALARDPKNADARHNKDLVEQQLEKKDQQKDPKAGDNQSGDQKDRGDQTSQNQDPSKNADDSGQRGDNQQPQEGQQSKDSKQGDQQAQDRQQQSAQKGADQPPASRQQQQQQQQASQGQDASKPQSSAQNQQAQPGDDDAEQAKRDAQEAVARQNAAPQPQQRAGDRRPAVAPGDGSKQGAGGDPMAVPQRTEQQLAQEQWLRRIPDDPGGLLRRKFQIEHLRREQGANADIRVEDDPQ